MDEKKILLHAINGASAALRVACAEFARGETNPLRQEVKIKNIERAIWELHELQRKYQEATSGEPSDDDILREAMLRKMKGDGDT